MYYPDLRSLADVDALAMPEFNLRVECLAERIRWERSLGTEAPPMRPVPKRKLVEILADLQARRLTEDHAR